MMIVPGASRYKAAVNRISGYVEDLKIEKPTNTNVLCDVLNALVSEALRLRVNIEYEKLCRGELEKE